MITTNYNSTFPNQVVPDEEKSTWEYGLQVGRAIENEWFRNNRGGDRFMTNYQQYHTRRLYSRGEQSVQKYKDELSINGDMSYLNLDWKPIPIISKFVDIVVNGMSQRDYDVKAYAQDPESQKKRTTYAEAILRDIQARSFLKKAQSELNLNLYTSADPENLPENKEELDLHMQLSYKQSIEIAEEEAISNILAQNKYTQTRKRILQDLVVLGISCVKTNFNPANGIKVEYVDPASLVYSYTEDPNFEDIYYVGEVKSLTMGEVKKQFPNLTEEEMEKIQKFPGTQNYLRNWGEGPEIVQVLFFEYKTYNNQIFKIKYTDQGLEKALEKPDTFAPPPNDNFERIGRSIEVLYTGAKILGIENMLEWKLAENMTRPTSNMTKVNMNYQISAPRMYRGRVESLVSKCISFADMIQLTHLKLQQVLARMVPDGVFVDVDGLAEVDLGNGTNYNPQEALNMYFQTGSIVGRSLTQDGDPNRGKIPIQELQTSSANGKIQSLIGTYNYYLQMIRDVTGLNEARDGSMPDKDALVGIQKLAAANSNVATRHILQASSYLTVKIAENISLKIADVLEYDMLAQSLKDSISNYNVGSLQEMKDLNLFEFGIYLELEPDEEEKAMLEQNIQVALQSGQIFLEDAIDIRQIKNLKLANQMLKVKRKVKMKQDQEMNQANIQAQANANAEASERAAMAEVQKNEAMTQSKLQLEQGKSNFEIAKLEQEAIIKKELMELEFQYNIKLTEAQNRTINEKEAKIEDRKDQRTRIQATQQSEMISQRKNDLLPKNFESNGNDTLGGGMNLEQFAPR
jgi:hypothetical protein|tara:strand:+ start:263 stop:2665 length:2403 start_codon:yes stop_codon:yes gene_type:complete